MDIQFQNPLLAVSDMERSLAFYENMLGLSVIADYGANKTLTGGVCLQTLDTWQDFIDGAPVCFGGNAAELYFTTNDFDAFAQKLETLQVRYVHPPKEYAWGQRVVRMFDPDGHVLEIGEPLSAVCRRFEKQGMTPEQIAVRMDVPIQTVEECLKQKTE